MNELTMITALDKETGKPANYTLEGTLTHDGEKFIVGLYSTCFNRVFDEMIYWVHTIEASHEGATVSLTFKTVNQ